jgi:hypothetical protein
VFVAFADTGGTPVNSSAGNATKLPPPATALIAPPSAPAKNRKMACAIVKPAFYHDSRSGSSSHAAGVAISRDFLTVVSRHRHFVVS